MGLFHRSLFGKLLSLIIISLLFANFSLSAVTIKPVLGSDDPLGLTLKWKTPLGVNGSTLISALAADLNGDGKMEIVVTGGSAQGGSDGSVTALDGSTGNVVWQVQPGGVGAKTPFEIADINNDGKPEILVSGLYPVVLNGADGSIYWKNTAVSSYNLWSAICDINADGYPEIFVSSGRGPAQGYDYFTMLSYDGKILLQNNSSWHPCWGGLTIGDPTSNGTFILYQGDRCWGYRTSPTPEEPYINGGWGVRALDAATLTPLWNDSSVTCSSHPPILADVDKDGIPDVIATYQGTTNGGLIVLNATNGVVSTAGGKYRKASNLGLPSHSEPTVYDIDGDGNLEIITCRDTNPKIWDLYDWKLDAVLPIVCEEPPKVADINGDGKMEIIAPSGNSIYIYEYNSSSMNYDQVDLITGLNVPRPFTLVQDVDGDGINELIVTSSSGWVYCYDTVATAPTPRVRSELSFYSERHCGAAEYVPPPGPLAPIISEPSPSDGATNIAVSLSQLTFKLFDYQHNPISYNVTTNPDIGSGSQPNVSNGRYSIPINGLSYNTAYTWTVTATDGTNSTTKTFTFTTGNLPPWYSTDWQYRRQIIIDHTKVSGTQTNFSVVIDLTDSNLKNKTQPDGKDFLFTDKNQNKLSHEIELYNDTTGHLIAWVNVLSISPTTDTTLYMYYGNATCGNQQNTTGVWDLNNMLVLHLDEKAGTQYDSTINGNNATAYNGVSQGVTGKIDGSDTFDGVGGYLQIPDNSTLAGFTQGFTASFWLRLGNVTKTQRILNKNNGAALQKSWYIEYQTNLLGLFVSMDGSTYKEWHAAFQPTAGAWYYVAVIWQNGTVPTFYVNGTMLATVGMSTVSSMYNNTGAPLYIGTCPYYTTRYLTGGLDEVRISNLARSADWMLTSYNNQKDPSTFYQVGTEESLSSAPFVTGPNPGNGAVNVTLGLTSLTFSLTDYQNDPINWTVTTNPDIGSLSQQNVPNGNYSVPIHNLQGSTLYTWTVNMTDGTNPSSSTFIFTTEAAGNKPPTQGVPLLVSNSGTNMTNANIVCYNTTTFDPNYDPVTNVYNWMRNNASISSLLMSFNTNSSSTVKDYSGNGNNGVVTNATWINNGVVGGAYSFDGTTSYITVPHSTSLDGGGNWNQITLEAWIKLSSNQRGRRIITKVNSYQLGFQSSGNNNTLYFGVWNNASSPTYYEVQYSTPLQLNTWYHLVCTYVSGIGSTIYINGASVPVTRTQGNPSGNVRPSSGKTVDIGRLSGNNASYFAGIIDEVRMCGNRSLTAAQATQNWLQSKDGLSSNSTMVSAELVAGDVWTCQVTPNDGSLDGASQTSNPITMMPVQAQYTLTVTTNGLGSVLVNNTGPYFSGVQVQLTAVPSLGWSFSAWGGDLSGNTNPAVITMDGNKTLSATFTQDQYTLTINIQGNGSVTKAPDQSTYTYNTSVQLTAVPQPGYTLANWTGDLSGNLNPAFVKMTANMNITAVFVLKQSNWWNTSWLYRRTITINHQMVSSNQTDFPVLINLTDSGLTTKAQTNGSDFVFTDANQAKLSHEIESYDSSTGHLIVWVKVPFLPSTNDTVLYMYYGNPTCGNQQNTTGVWDLNNMLVLHLDEKAGTQYDSTINGNNATAYNGVSQGTSSKIDGYDAFDGVNDYLQIPHNDALSGFSSGFTASFWLRLDNVTKRQTILNEYNNVAGNRSWYIEYQTNLLGFFASQDGTTYAEWHAAFQPTAGAWYYVTITWKPNTVPAFYVNGTQLTTKGSTKIASIYNNTGAPLYIGRCPYDATRYLAGGLDEIHISNSARSADWILTNYKNQKDPSTFCQIGVEEGQTL